MTVVEWSWCSVVGKVPLGRLHFAPRAWVRCRVPGGFWVIGGDVSVVLEGASKAGVDVRAHRSPPAWVLVGRVDSDRGIWIVSVVVTVELPVMGCVVHRWCHPSVVVWDWLIGVAHRGTGIACSNHRCGGGLRRRSRLSFPPVPEWDVLLEFGLISVLPSLNSAMAKFRGS